jgi:hypothetical protein
MKNAVKSGIFFGLFMSAWFIVAAIFIDKEGAGKGILVGIIEGLSAGFLFGHTVYYFGKRTDKAVQFDPEPGENLLFQSGANHFQGLEAVGGKLILTNKRLVFKSHSLNIQRHTLSVPLSQLQHAERYKTMGLVNNGLKIVTGTGTEKFVVDKAAEWQSMLLNKINMPPITTETA